MSSQVTKGVITAAGYGTRFLPATKALPKELLPVMGKPVLQYTVEEMAESGIEDILIVISQGKEAIPDYFDRDYDYEKYLENQGKLDRMSSLIEVCKQVNFYYARQSKMLGNGHALLQAKEFIGDEPFAFADGDSIIDTDTPVVGQTLKAFEQTGANIIGASRLEDKEEMTKYGNIYASKTDQDRVYKVEQMAEKPEIENTSEQGLIVAGMRYIFTDEIWQFLETQGKGKDGEIWVSDAADRMLNSEDSELYAYEYEGEYFDTGTPESMFKAEKNLQSDIR
jgi:UTP--glucose-1-phosphate uridylyltransferase